MKECIMLAAGLSQRMGTWKMLLPWGTGTVLDSALGGALSFCDRVILVTGHRADELHQRYRQHPQIALCFNASYRAGMFSSVQRGVAALCSEEPFFIVPGDMPAVDPNVYAALWRPNAIRCQRPVCDSGKGHPVLLPPALAPTILAAPPESNLRQLMLHHGCQDVQVTSKSIHWDLDTPEQYQQLHGLLS
ncbi:CTP--molybdopterin cytidylyltransferase [Erwinia sp. 9145]|uniref:CTP--molybdopterin cytidylyltransferase n=1 Tax=Erwinia sp. 9145 TaxID=1500895 RepID=UPI000552D538|nr:CTP--molybdopterin cytidylyltransferase [Erwinia sp. 9145]